MTVSDGISSQLLPDVLPVFPLAGVLLLPGAQLPLNIFEPRYLNMVEDSLGDGRYIGMVQPRAADIESPEGEPDIYGLGCAGRIVSFSETGDGRFAITLKGVSRFRIAEELPLINGYRCVVPNFSDFAADLNEDQGSLVNRDDLLLAVQAYFAANEIEADWPSVENASDSALVTTLSMLCPFEASERQALLECADTAARGVLLNDLMTLSLHGDSSNNSNIRH
ncbi:MAG: peptidase S16 [Rhodospirillales bacterium]|jgi:uncharacterized protein|nr:peptidase S16 [Rhodospirillales bacterium]MBT4038995.1 peptidase S16 [Rhodospirillales bacterium]MBT4628165.1 peptidase S16 [Rhodospirillales bacterium]MBT5522143.1 peptidase S16 [Rhodospirillales bacterium]MBT6110744.1 peptidase S16 [Rhodospirillales bacterium]